MNYKILLTFLILFTANNTLADNNISPSLFFMRNGTESPFSLKPSLNNQANVTISFKSQPSQNLISQIEKHGIEFKRQYGNILHTEHIYPAIINLDSLESASKLFPEINSIESSSNPARFSILDVSAKLIRATNAWNLKSNNQNLTGKGVKIADVDTGIDIYHPAFFFPDGGSFNWIDVNKSGYFENGIDAVDLNDNSIFEQTEILSFYNADFSDTYQIVKNPLDTYDADIDWLYNDSNRNSIRDFGSDNGFNENSPCFGERIFIIEDSNSNNKLDPGEKLISLGSSKIYSVYDKNGDHYRSKNLLLSEDDLSNHGTSASGIINSQCIGRRFTGVAPDADIIAINRLDVPDVSEAVLKAVDDGAKIVMYEFGSWVYEFLDGSSNLEVFIKDLKSKGIHQFTASGNLAGQTRKKHSFFTLNSSQTDTLYFNVPSNYKISEVYISFLWRDDILNMPSTTLFFPDNSSIKFISDVTQYNSGIFTVQSGKQSSSKGTSRFDILISSTSAFSGDFRFLLKNSRHINLSFHAYISDNQSSWVGGAQFLNYITDNGTVCSPGTSENDITVASYDPRGYRNTLGDISDFSSWGETIDGRRAVDITAPGFTIFTPSSKNSTKGIPGGFVDFGGTSAALPHVAGCAALIVQALPSITPDVLSDALLKFSIKDEFTGNVPNMIWGYGKLDIYNSLTLANIATSVKETVKSYEFDVSEAFPNPFNSITFFILNNPSNKQIKIDIFNILGQKINSFEKYGAGKNIVSWDGRNLRGDIVASGIYLMKFSLNNSVITKRLTFTK